jgi:hypothetical protein
MFSAPAHVESTVFLAILSGRIFLKEALRVFSSCGLPNISPPAFILLNRQCNAM